MVKGALVNRIPLLNSEITIDIVRLHVKAPALRITDIAKSELLSTRKQVGGPELIACVMWVQGSRSSRRAEDGALETVERGPHWGVGFYSPSQIKSDDVFVIEGIKFTFDPSQVDRLDNATLDIGESGWVVRERAI